MKTTIGRFVPTIVNDAGFLPFDVVTKKPHTMAGFRLDPSEEGGFIGTTTDGHEYHVFSKYWDFEPAKEGN